ncbi:MAG: hypothetical protein Q9175_007305 [Cornicularia normoerica]
MAITAVVLHSPRKPSTTFPLDLLPNEIVHMVFEQLTRKFQQRDIARLRLVCKRFADIGNKYLLSEAHLFFKSSQFEQLRQISEHPIISKKVNTLFYEADALEDYGSLQDWKEHICVPGWMQELSPEGLHPPSPTASEREQRAYKRDLNKAMHGPKFTHSDTLLRRAYDKYTGYLADQENIRALDYNVEMLKDVMFKMPNLKTIEMSTECCLNNGRTTRMEQAFKDGLSSPYGDRQTEEGCGVGQLRSLLLAADAASLKLETLCVGNVDWRFFMETEKHNLETLRKMQCAVRSLRTLKLYVSTSSEWDDDFYLDAFSHIMVPECARYLHQTSHLKDFITATPDLERLDINFDCDDPYPPSTLCDSVGTFKWHALRVAAFAYISADEDCLVYFLARHASTLRKIRLDTVLLTTGSWPSLLQRARKLLKLEKATLSGRLRSNDLEESYYFDLPAGLNGGKRAKIEVAVEDYLVKGGDGPLLDLNRLVEKHYRTYVEPAEDLWDYVDTESDDYIMDRY